MSTRYYPEGFQYPKNRQSLFAYQMNQVLRPAIKTPRKTPTLLQSKGSQSQDQDGRAILKPHQVSLDQFRHGKNSHKKEKRIDTVRASQLQRRLSMKVLLASGKSKAASCGEATPVGSKLRRRAGDVGCFRKMAELDYKHAER
jgi:hypothetical protein